MSDESDNPEDALYAAPPEGFVAARDALARELRADGDKAGARRVRALRRPTRAAWAINVAVRADPDAARELAGAAAQLGEAQRELLAGGDAALLRDAQTRVDAVVAVLLAAVPVEDAATLEKVRQTLRAAVVDADALADVLSRRLERERVVSGFGDLGGALPPIASEPASSTASSGASAAKAAERAAQRAAREAEQQAAARAAAERAAAQRRERVERARAREATAEKAAVTARVALEEAEAVVERRRAERDAAEERLADAAREREQAERS